MSDGRTTDLARLRQGEPFTWGKLVEIVDVRYAGISVVVYRPWAVVGGRGRRGGGLLSNKRTTRKVAFHAYVGNRDTSNTHHTMEDAILYAMTYRSLGPNSHDVARAFLRGIGFDRTHPRRPLL